MKTTMSISKKIWLSLSIIVLGFFSTTMFSFIKGQHSETHLKITAEGLFPASQICHEANTAFENQVKAYEEAYMMGEAEELKKAEQWANNTSAALKKIIANKEIPQADKDTTEAIIKKHLAYTA